MTLEPTNSLRRLATAPLMLVAALSLVSSCESSGLGDVCPLGAPDPTLLTADLRSTSCPSSVCLRPPEGMTTNTGALCSIPCRTDADCEGGAKRDPREAQDLRCTTGFSCQAILLPPPAGSCQKMCLCRDFLRGGTEAPFSCE